MHYSFLKFTCSVDLVLSSVSCATLFTSTVIHYNDLDPTQVLESKQYM